MWEYAAKGNRDRPLGYIQLALYCLSNFSMGMNSGQVASLASKVYVTLVLPIRDPTTNSAKLLSNANGTTSMDKCYFGFVNDNVDDNTIENGEAWCRNLVKQFNAFLHELIWYMVVLWSY